MGRVSHWNLLYNPLEYRRLRVGPGLAIRGLINVKYVETNGDIVRVHPEVVDRPGSLNCHQSLSPNSGQCLSPKREGEMELGRGVHEIPPIP